MAIDPQNINVRYLLGELSDEEMSALEARYFAEPEAFDEITAAESDLIDAYSRDRLPFELRERLEKFYMADPTRRERVRFGQALDQRLGSERVLAVPASSWLDSLRTALGSLRPAVGFSFAAAALLLVLGGIWLFIGRQKPDTSEVAKANAVTPSGTPAAAVIPRESREDGPTAPTEPASTPQVGVTPAPKSTKPSPTPDVQKAPRSVSIVLAIGGVRGSATGPTQTLSIPRGTEEARISVRLRESTYPAYRLSLQTLSGTEIAARLVRTPAATPVLGLTVPASKLQDGDYILSLSGIGDDDSADELSKSLFRVRHTR